MIKHITTAEVDAKFSFNLLGFYEFGDVEVDFSSALYLESEVFFHIKQVVFKVGYWAFYLF